MGEHLIVELQKRLPAGYRLLSEGEQFKPGDVYTPDGGKTWKPFKDAAVPGVFDRDLHYPSARAIGTAAAKKQKSAKSD